MFAAKNALTGPTALSLLHLLHHLRAEAGCCLEKVDSEKDAHLIWSYSGRHIRRLDLNFELAPTGCGHQLTGTTASQGQPRLLCRRLNCDKNTQILASLPRLFSHCHSLHGIILPRPIDLRNLLDSIANGCVSTDIDRCVVRRLEFHKSDASGLSSREIDFIVRHFQQREASFKSCMSQVVFPARDIPLTEWPSLCLPAYNDPAPAVPCSHMQAVREFCFINELSGEEFRVELVVEAGWYGSLSITEFRLYFN